jgi:hypothetical protein
MSVVLALCPHIDEGSDSAPQVLDGARLLILRHADQISAELIVYGENERQEHFKFFDAPDDDPAGFAAAALRMIGRLAEYAAEAADAVVMMEGGGR